MWDSLLTSMPPGILSLVKMAARDLIWWMKPYLR